LTVEEFSDVGVSKDSADGDGTAWGLASLALGAVVFLAAPTTLVFNVLLWKSGHAGVPVLLATLGASLGLLAMMGLACCGIAFGIRGRRIDRDHRRPSPLSTAGVLVGLAAAIVWIPVGIDLIMILSSFH
jgi:hypothetical protein